MSTNQMTALCSGKICTIFPEKGALNFWKACTIALEYSQTDENTILGQINGIEKEIKKTEKKLSKLFDAWENDTITDNEFVQRKEVNTNKIEELKAEIEKLENTIPEKEDYEEKIMSFSDALAALKDNTLEADVKNEYLKRIIERIEYSRENNNEFILDIYIK